MPDDAWDEDEAIERLNDLCEPGVYFALCEGDVRLMDDDD